MENNKSDKFKGERKMRFIDIQNEVVEKYCIVLCDGIDKVIKK